MALRTTSAAGSFTDGTKWSGGVAPVSGDTLAINHAMTWAPPVGFPYTETFTIGTGTGTAITFGTGGSLTLTPLGAFQLTIAGSTAGGNTSTREFVVNSTNGPVSIAFDATSAGAGFAMIAGGNYSVTNGGGWNLTGNSTYGITVLSIPSDGTKNSYFTNGGTGGGGNIAATYTTFQRIGSSSQAAFAPTLDNRQRSLIWSDVTLDACGQITLSGDTNYTGTITFTRVKSTNSATNGTTSWPIQYGMTNTPTANFNECSFDKPLKFIATRGFNGNKCYFHDGWQGTSGAYIGGTLANSFIRQTYDSIITAFSITDSFHFWDAPAGTNQHFVSVNDTGLAGSTMNLLRNAYYTNSNDPSGNPIVADPTSAFTLNVKNNIVLKNPAGKSSGVLFTSNQNLAAIGFAINIEHNTVFVGDQYGIEIGHEYSSVESSANNRYKSVKSNLFVGDGVNTAFKAKNPDSSTLTDIVPPAIMDYNGSYQITATSGISGYTNEGRGYASKWSVTPGANDIDGVDPAFVNGSASLFSWAFSAGYYAEEGARAAIQANPALTIDLMAYLAAAYRPTAAAYNNAGHDGLTIGAFAYQPATTGQNKSKASDVFDMFSIGYSGNQF